MSRPHPPTPDITDYRGYRIEITFKVKELTGFVASFTPPLPYACRTRHKWKTLLLAKETIDRHLDTPSPTNGF